MTTEKLVFSKLFPKTELETHKVDLALTDDFKSIFDKSNSEQESIGQNLIKALSKAETDYKQNLQNLQNAKKIGDDLSSKAKDLGIDLPKEYVKATEELRAMYKKIVDLNKTFNSIKI